MNNQISLRIHSVKCLDETGGKWVEKVGNDEIFLAGFGIDVNANTSRVGAFEVYAHFDDGDIKTYSPPRNFVTLTLANNSSFPKTCSVGFILAEKDAGDFGSKAAAIYDKVREEMEKKKREQEEEQKRMGRSALTSEDLRVVWEIVKPILYSWIKDKIISAANDDVFPPSDTSVTIPSADFTWDGSKISPPSAVQFRGHDGLYLLTYDWELA
jgi:hypothetical protein